MELHLRLQRPYCLLCRHSIAVSENTVGVLGFGSDYLGCTLPFSFPGHGPGDGPRSYCATYFDGIHAEWQLCRSLWCSECQTSPPIFLLHMDCLRLLKRRVPAKTLFLTWLFGVWTRPWPGAIYQRPKPYISLGLIVENMDTNSTPSLCYLLEKIARLPLEICTTIIEYSANSPLWRFARVLELQPELFKCLRRNPIKTLLLNDLNDWVRGDQRNNYNQRNNDHDQSITLMNQGPFKYFRIYLDDFGIISIQLFKSCSALSNIQYCPWYIVGDIACLDNFDIESNGYFIRLAPRQSQIHPLLLWDTPNPPNLASCRVFNNSFSIPKHLRCITLDNGSFTGLSGFCSGDQTYSIYAHTNCSPPATDVFRRIAFEKKQVVWLYFPLKPGEKVNGALVRRWKSYPSIGGYNLVIRTTYNRVFTFGKCVDPSSDLNELCHLSESPITELFYDDPDGTAPLLYVGAQSRAASDILPPWPPIGVSTDEMLLLRSFSSSASLKGVEKACLFLDRYEHHDGQFTRESCFGILFTYQDGSQEALGQCRIGLSTQLSFLHPQKLYWKEINFWTPPQSGFTGSLFGIDVRFSSKSLKYKILDAPLNGDGWHSTEMSGVLEWWFDYGRVLVRTKRS